MAVQICEQIITGRNYDYARALATIQNEEYLRDSDFAKYTEKITQKHDKVFKAVTGNKFQSSEILNKAIIF